MGKQIIIYKQEESKQRRILPLWPGQAIKRLPDASMMSENSDEEQYTCRFCEKVLYSPRSLQIHEDRHRETLKFSCIYCDKTFPTQTTLARHERTHTGEEEYPCAECDAGFSDKAALVNHTVKMHTVQIEQCDLTQSINVDRKAYISTMDSIKSSQNKQSTPPPQMRSFPISSKSENYVSTTTKSEGSKEARFQCGYCDKSFATPSKVKRHILTHTGEKPFVCQFCQRGFSQKVHMMEHISKHHADESLKAQQDAAASAAAQAAVAQAQAPAPLIKTIAQQKTVGTPVYTSQSLSQTSGLTLTQGSTLVRLPTNQTFTATQVSLADSTAVQITPIPENSYIVAEFSLKPETQPMSLSDQEQYENEEEGSEQEQESTEIMATLPLAQGGYHGLPRSPFSQSPNFDGGQGNERPFVCPHCSADFIRQSNLSVHMMKVHGETVEVRTHQCSYCDKKFKYPNKRRLHEMTHTGEKPNVCQFCTMGFFKKSRLRVHLTKHHGIPEEEVNNPNSSYLASPSGNAVTAPPSPSPQQQLSQSTTQIVLPKALVQQIQAQSNGDDMEEGDLFCQYCQKPFSNQQELLVHERQEAMEFEQLHEMFEDTEFTGLEVTGTTQTDIIQNALLTAGIENGLGSPSVTDSDSVVTISEADIDSFSIGFIPDATWSSHEVVTSNLPPISSTSSDHFYPSAQPLDLNAKSSTHQSQTIESTSQDLSNISGTIYTTSETFQNIKTDLPTSLPNEMWETTVALSSLPTNIVTSLAGGIKAEDIATSTTPLNGIYTETFTLNNGSQQMSQDTMTTSIINLAPNQAAQIINGNELDFSKLSGVTTHTNFSLSQTQTFLEADGLSSSLGGIHPTSTTKVQPINWQDDPTLPVGWKTRQHYREGQANKVDIYYMSPDGTQFRSKWKVVEFMEAAGSYLQEEIEWVRASITTPRPEAIILLPKERTDKLKREWKDDDPTVPPGWKVAWTTTSDNRSKIAFMSPDKKIFHSRKAALQHMMAAGTYDPEDIVKMTKGLNVLLNVGDEWKEGDKSLPEGWKIRSHQWWCQKRNSHRIHYEFLSPHNEFFKSRKAVVEHMMQNGVYTEEQIETVRQQTTIITDRSGKQKKGVTAGVGGVAKEVSSPCNPLIGWKAGNSSLPPGWKIKRHEYANQTVYFYMSPKGDIIKSRRAVIDYMFQDENYTEKDFNIVISGAKQRKAVLQELYDAKVKRRARRKKRSRSDAAEEEEDDDDFDEETEEPKIDSDEELDPVEDDDKFEDAKKCHKNKKPDKEPVLPTRRSGRIRIKEEKQKEEHESGAEDSESESESMSPSGEKVTSKRRVEETEVEVDSLTPEPKRKRGRPPKVLSQSFDLMGLKGESEEEMIADTLLKVEQKMGDSLVKLDGNLFKVELSSQEDIKDFNLTDAPEIKMGETPLHNAIKDEFKFSVEPSQPNSIQCNQKEGGDSKLTVSQFYVDGGIKNDFANKVSTTPTTSVASNETSAEAAYAVVVNVLKEIVSSISD